MLVLAKQIIARRILARRILATLLVMAGSVAHGDPVVQEAAGPLASLDSRRAVQTILGRFEIREFNSSGGPLPLRLTVFVNVPSEFDLQLKELHSRPNREVAFGFLSTLSPGKEDVIALVGERLDQKIRLRLVTAEIADGLKSNSPGPAEFLANAVVVGEGANDEVELYHLPNKFWANDSRERKWTATALESAPDYIAVSGPFAQRINAASLDDANDVVAYRYSYIGGQGLVAKSLPQSVYALYVSSQNKRYAVTKFNQSEISRYSRAFLALEKAGLRLPKSELEKSNTPELRRILKESLGREMTGSEFVTRGVELFGSWDGAVSGTCGRPKTVLTALVRVEGDSFFGFQFYPDVPSVQLPLRFRVLPDEEKLIKFEGVGINRGWPASFDMNLVVKD